MIELLIFLFVVMVGFSAIKILIKLFWVIMAPLSTLGAALIVLYLFSLVIGK